MRVRTPLQAPPGRRLRVLIYARYSSEEQNPSSIKDQIGYCEKILALNGVVDADIDTLSDAEISGELTARPGIDKVRDGLLAHKWDVLIVEDTSRLFRNR